MLKKLIIPLMAAVPLMLSASTLTQKTFSTEQSTEVKTIVREYLKANPKVVIDAIMAYRQDEITKYQKVAAKTILLNKVAIFDTNNNLVMGNPKGAITLVEFLDYRCGHCKTMGPVVTAAIKANSDLKVVVKELPIFGGPSVLAAQAALAAQKQGAFVKLHDFFLTTKNPITKANIFKQVRFLGLNLRQFKKDLTSTFTKNYVNTNMKLAKVLKISATPTFILSTKNGEYNQLIPGAVNLEQLQAMIKAMRAKSLK